MKTLYSIGIDDEEHCNTYLKECCQKIPLVKLVETFTDPFKALPLIRSGNIDLIFLDFNMGKVNAPEFITEFPGTVQVIIISAEREAAIKEYDMKLTAILPKPFTCESLLKVSKLAARLKR